MKRQNKKITLSENVGKGRIFRSLKTVKYLEGIVRGKQKLISALEAGYAQSTARNAKYIIEETQKFKNLESLLAYYLCGDRSDLECTAIVLLQQKRAFPASHTSSVCKEIILRPSIQKLQECIIDTFFEIENFKVESPLKSEKFYKPILSGILIKAKS